MENMLLDWMADLVGYPESAAGSLSSGGSIANLGGIVAARDAHGLKARDFERSVIYLTDHVHHSVDKAIRIAGLGESARTIVPVDARRRMDPEALEEAIQKDKAAGLSPWLVIASAGTADTGAVDPLGNIGEIASRRSLPRVQQAFPRPQTLVAAEAFRSAALPSGSRGENAFGSLLLREDSVHGRIRGRSFPRPLGGHVPVVHRQNSSACAIKVLPPA